MHTYAPPGCSEVGEQELGPTKGCKGPRAHGCCYSPTAFKTQTIHGGSFTKLEAEMLKNGKGGQCLLLTTVLR